MRSKIAVVLPLVTLGLLAGSGHAQTTTGDKTTPKPATSTTTTTGTTGTTATAKPTAKPTEKPTTTTSGTTTTTTTGTTDGTKTGTTDGTKTGTTGTTTTTTGTTDGTKTGTTDGTKTGTTDGTTLTKAPTKAVTPMPPVATVSGVGQGKCSLSSTALTGAPIGGSTVISMATIGWGTTVAYFQFGYMNPRISTPVLLGTAKSDTLGGGSLKFSAPVPESSKTETKFVVSAMSADGSSLGRASCSIIITRPTTTELTTVRTEKLETLATLATTAKTDGTAVSKTNVLAAAQSATGTTDSTTTKEEKKKVKTNVVSALHTTFLASSTSSGSGTTTTTSSSTAMTKEERKATIQVLAQACTDSKKDSSTTDEEKKQLRGLVTAVLDAKASDIDTENQAGEILTVIDEIEDKDTISTSTRSLGKACGTNLAVGKSQTVSSVNYNITATKKTAKDCRGAKVQSGATTITIPSGLVDKIPNVRDDTEVAVTTVDYKTNPAKEGTDADLKAQACEIDLTADGTTVEVRDLDKPADIQMDLKEGATKTEGKEWTCSYYDRTTEKWSTEGVTTGDSDWVSGTVDCQSTHMSLFSVFEGDSSSGAASFSSALVFVAMCLQLVA